MLRASRLSRELVLGVVPELIRVLAVVPRVEHGRRTVGPAPLLEALRVAGARRRRRDEAERARLRRVIGWVDRLFPGGGNCYRRVLLEIALDAGAAGEPVTMGLVAGGGPGSGHAWMGERRDGARERYDVELRM